MSLEQSLSRKLVLAETGASAGGTELSSSSSTQSETGTLTVSSSNTTTTAGILKSSRGKSPGRNPSLSTTGDTSALPSPPPYTSSNSVPSLQSSGGGGGGGIRSHRSVSLSVSAGSGKSSGNKNNRPNSPPVGPRTNTPPGVPPDRVHSTRLTRKIFNNWRSACGRTKDKTKDFIRRWKTLPENHPDFEDLVGLAGMSPPPEENSGGQVSHNTPPSGTSTRSRMGLGKKQKSECVDTVDHHDDPGSGTGVVGIAPKSSTGWSVHIWATWVQRGNEDDIESEETPPGRTLLSEFQKVKLTYFFRHVLDMNHDDVISAEDFVALNQRIRHYIEWSSECMEFHILKEVHSGFLEYFLNQPLDECSHMFYSSPDRETRDNVNIDEWLDIWGGLLHSARNLQSLPLWLQYFPKILFQVINKSGSGTISKEELRAFYTMFLGIDFRVVNETLDSIYNAMTDEGHWKINWSLFKLCFTNFLLGKYPHGPGQYLFGICSPQSVTSTFPIDYSALNTPPELLQPYDPDHDKEQTNRRSVIV